MLSEYALADAQPDSVRLQMLIVPAAGGAAGGSPEFEFELNAHALSARTAAVASIVRARIHRRPSDCFRFRSNRIIVRLSTES